MTTIYKITNKLNGKPYIGQTCQPLEKRFFQHASVNTPLGKAMRDCGLENFTIEVIEECKTPEQTKERERFWISVLKCKVPNGYNQSDGGESCLPKTSHPRIKIGSSLKRFRKTFNLKQNKVAEMIGVTPQQYVKYEKDQITPSVAIVIDLANAYNVSTDYLLGRSDMPHPTNFDEKEVKEAFAVRDAWQKAIQTLPKPTGQVPAQ